MGVSLLRCHNLRSQQTKRRKKERFLNTLFSFHLNSIYSFKSASAMSDVLVQSNSWEVYVDIYLNILHS